MEELQKDYKNAHECNLSFDVFLKVQKATNSHSTPVLNKVDLIFMSRTGWTKPTNCNSSIFKSEDDSQAVEKAERVIQEVLQKEEELERLKEKHAQLRKRKQELELEVQRHYMYWDFMLQVVNMSKVLQGFFHMTKSKCFYVS